MIFTIRSSEVFCRSPEVEVRVGVAVVHHLHQPVIQPARQFPPEGEEEQGELHKAQRDDRFKVPCREQQDHRNTNYQRHFEETPAHRQRGGRYQTPETGHSSKPRADDPADAAEQLRLAEIIPRIPHQTRCTPVRPATSAYCAG